MAKKKTKRRYTRRKKTKRRRRPFKPSVELVSSTIAIPFTPPVDGWATPIQAIQDGQPELALQSLVRGFSGIALPMGGQAEFHFDPLQALNPFDFGEARYWKMMFWGGLAGKIRKKLVPRSSDMFKKIPLIGKYIS